MLLGLALLVGIIAGLRAMMAPLAVSWAAYLGMSGLTGTWLSFLAHPYTHWIFTLLAAGELFNDKRPTTPSRTIPPQFGARIIMGALGGAAIGASGAELVSGAIAGVFGAILGTLDGRAVRGKLAAAFGKDLPAALLEDVVAIALAAYLIIALS